MSAEETCHAIAAVERPEDKEPVAVWCEKEPRHDGQHHGHIYYKEDDGTVTSRCVTWGD